MQKWELRGCAKWEIQNWGVTIIGDLTQCTFMYIYHNLICVASWHVRTGTVYTELCPHLYTVNTGEECVYNWSCLYMKLHSTKCKDTCCTWAIKPSKLEVLESWAGPGSKATTVHWQQHSVTMVLHDLKQVWDFMFILLHTLFFSWMRLSPPFSLKICSILSLPRSWAMWSALFPSYSIRVWCVADWGMWVVFTVWSTVWVYWVYETVEQTFSSWESIGQPFSINSCAMSTSSCMAARWRPVKPSCGRIYNTGAMVT